MSVREMGLKVVLGTCVHVYILQERSRQADRDQVGRLLWSVGQSLTSPLAAEQTNTMLDWQTNSTKVI